MDKQWFVRTNPTQYPDLFTYDVMERNTEPEKYQGIKEFGVASGLDSKENAYLIAEAPRLFRELRATQTILAKITNNGWIRDGEIEKQAQTAIIKAEALMDRLERLADKAAAIPDKS